MFWASLSFLIQLYFVSYFMMVHASYTDFKNWEKPDFVQKENRGLWRVLYLPYPVSDWCRLPVCELPQPCDEREKRKSMHSIKETTYLWKNKETEVCLFAITLQCWYLMVVSHSGRIFLRCQNYCGLCGKQ